MATFVAIVARSEWALDSVRQKIWQLKDLSSAICKAAKLVFDVALPASGALVTCGPKSLTLVHSRLLSINNMFV